MKSDICIVKQENRNLQQKIDVLTKEVDNLQ
jgi:hypothetical protein